MIWATDGIAYPSGSEPSSRPLPGQHKWEGVEQSQIAEINDRFDSTWQLLSDANIAVYVVDMKELTNSGYTSPSYQASQLQNLQMLGFGFRAQAMNGFTDKTGGSYCPLRSRLEDCFSNAMEDSRQYYMLAYYPAKRAKPGWRKLTVEVADSNTKVHTRTGYFFREIKRSSETRQDEVAETLASPLDATGVPLIMRWMEGKPAEPVVPGTRRFEVRIDPRAITIESDKENHFSLSITAAARNGKGKYNGELAKKVEGHLRPADLKRILENGLVFRDSIPDPEAETEVRFVVRDELSGRIGSLTVKLVQSE